MDRVDELDRCARILGLRVKASERASGRSAGKSQESDKDALEQRMQQLLTLSLSKRVLFNLSRQ